MITFGEDSATDHSEARSTPVRWDDEADVVCTDAGVAGLAAAISALDEGADVLVASSPVPEPSGAPGSHQGWFSLDSGDSETSAYLAELADGLDAATLPQPEDVLPIRLAPEMPATPGRRIPPFVGSQLRDWAARCIPSPSGYLYTRVTDWTTTAMESAGGDAIEVAEIGSMSPDPGDVMGSVLEWLNAEAHTRGVGVQPVMRFERLVFDERAVIGAVFTTSDGPFAIRARHGVLFCRAGIPADQAARLPVAGDAVLRVALVSKAASRFGRVELLTSDPAVARPAAASSGAPSEALEHA
ncbi:MAG: hypothetical protein ACXWZL_07335 [Mycobacterium sp.]